MRENGFLIAFLYKEVFRCTSSARIIISEGGGERNSKLRMLSMPSDLSCRTTEARFVLTRQVRRTKRTNSEEEEEEEEQ